MFKSLKQKLASWTKKVSKEKEISDDDKKQVVKIKEKLVDKPEEKTEIEETIQELPKKEEVEKGEEIVDKSKTRWDEHKKEGGPQTKGIFKKITHKVKTTKISEQEFDVYAEELQNLLLENNVAFEVVEKIIQELRENIVGKDLLRKEIEGEIKDIFKEIINRILVEPFDLVEKIKKKNSETKEPYVVILCGINGSGKTTSIAKLTHLLKNKGISCVLAAGDTFRAASIEQLKKHGDKLGVKVISQTYGSDPAAVGFDAIKYAKKNFINCVLIDTAGRMHTAKNLLKEIEKIVKVTKPDTKIFVGESLTGNDAIEQAKSFNWAVGIDGIILTKSDVDEKGGTSLSVGYVTKKPILFLGTGQQFDEIEVFNKQKFIERLGL